MPSKRRIETIQYLTGEEMKALLAAIRREIRAKSNSPRADTRRNVYRDRAVFTLAYRYGLRAEEVGRLRMADYDASARKLFVTRVKNGISRHYPLYDDELTALRAHLRKCGDDSPEAPLFPSNRGTGIDRKMLHVLMRRYGGIAGIPVAKQMVELSRHGKKELAAMRAGMDPITARQYRREGKLPSEKRRPRAWRTRDDRFAEVWDEVAARLGATPVLLSNHVLLTKRPPFGEIS
ncbi:tyrosine-type recombinase/integrase [Candidatus Poribacteria bacterium]|jgi:integrase|nr:tyrosine-type recombinase/integrase [Candidatus Poribacteria bacterium]